MQFLTFNDIINPLELFTILGGYMHNVRKINDGTYWLGASDRRIALFENTYPLPNGVSYNNYLVLDEKTCLFDGIDSSVTRQFFENLDYVLNGRDLDYMVIHHMEPDHCAAIPELVKNYSKLKFVGSAKVFQMIEQFYHLDLSDRKIVIKEGSSLNLGKHELEFVAAPMVHWPEVMMTYDKKTGILFSADAFGAFGAMDGNIFADEVNWEKDWLDEARRYYTNIVGKYGKQVMAVLKKVSKFDVKMLCPLHAHIWRKDLDYIIDKYIKWASYEAEEKSVAIFYGSVYGHTAQAADILAVKLAELGLKNIRVYDSSKTDVSYMLSRAFEYSHLVFASSTYNLQIFDKMDYFLTDLKHHNMGNKIVGIMENGSWSPQTEKLIKERVENMNNMTILNPVVHIASSVNDESLKEIDDLAKALVESLKK